MLKQKAADRDAIQRVIARTIGMTASICCYPTLEMLRFCKNQTYCRFDPGLGGRAVIDTLHQSELPPFDRNFEGPRPGLLYTTAWLSLEQGHRHLAPSSIEEGGRDASVFTFFDLYGETIAEIEGNAIPAGGIELLGPHTPIPPADADRMQLACPTHLVWFIGRTQGGPDKSTVPSPRLRLTGPEGTLSLRRPAVLDLWAGGRSDPFVDIVDRGEAAQNVAPAFYDNLCRALAYLPMRSEDRHLARIFKLVGLGPSAALDWNALPAPHRIGLIEGFEDAARVVCAGALAQAGHAGHATVPPTHHHRKLERAIRVRQGVGIHLLDRAALAR